MSKPGTTPQTPVAEKTCTFLISYDKGSPSMKELKEQLESSNVEHKIAAMKKIILLHVNGEPLPQLLVPIIRYVLPCEDKFLKKLLFNYWELVEKRSPDGRMLPEMLLVPNFFRIDLTHPNEYVRGFTLRFLCKVREPQILEPLIPSIRQNLDHRHSYVRRNAIMTVYSVYKTSETLMPDAPELVEKFLSAESDVSSKRNAFLMLFECAQERAVAYLRNNVEQVANAGDSFQLILLDMLRKLCRKTPTEKPKYMRIIFSLLGSKSSSVLFQAASTLVSLSSAPAAIKAAATCYAQLLTTHSDNNVKLIVLDRLVELKQNHAAVLQGILMDILRALSSPNMDIRRKILDIVMDLVSSRSVEDVMNFLKKEVIKTQSQDFEKNGEYQQVLVQAIHTCAVRFPEVAHSVVHLLMDFLGDSNAASAVDVALFVREIVDSYPSLADSVLQKLAIVFPSISSPRVFRCVLWVLGTYSITADQIKSAFECIKASVGDLTASPNPDQKEEKKEEVPTSVHHKTPSTTTRVLADGTYATQSAASDSAAAAASPSSASATKSGLRGHLFAGDFFLGAVVASTLSKLALRAQTVAELSSTAKAALLSEATTILQSIIVLGLSSLPTHRIDKDSQERIAVCLRLLSATEKGPEGARAAFLQDSREAFAAILKAKALNKDAENSESDTKGGKSSVEWQPDRLISFSQLKGQRNYDGLDLDEDLDVTRATGNLEKEDTFASRLNRTTQLTGFSDPVYAEACVTVHQFDILLDVLVVNQTHDTLQNLSIEFATVGDLKLCERPQTHTIAPFASIHIKANIKVSSTETGIIFGNILYDATSAGNDRNCIILSDIHVDIMDYIKPSTCTDSQFRSMWAEFEWENKVAVNTDFSGLHEFLDHICKSTNMRCLTPAAALDGACEFLSANLYARSNFGEDALANISIEKLADGKIGGFIRIRSKTQGIALSLGDKITTKQRVAA